ncbi:hypothetical protein E6O75_ATG05484 [Venturia nashicola]|uniref:Uncharacterized protein n=1 Tax=Venturia nashicola TaxID=86259 RepID=A0A4Z1PDI2_9PEZI|nr:hypothetical protein E6O75_ATG05484 [Venturia nashicola]
MVPCILRREDCLKGSELAKRLQLHFCSTTGKDGTTATAAPNPNLSGGVSSSHHSTVTTMAASSTEVSPFWNSIPPSTVGAEKEEGACLVRPERELSPFERVFTSHPPVLESLLAQLPTRSILDLSHTSVYLRNFLQRYPLAWRTLSFRLPQPTVILGSPGIETPESKERQSKAYALDGLLIQKIIPHATILKSLDLCNTAVSGVALVSDVLNKRKSTLEHLSVRGCKNVSIKYHIVPFLQLNNPHHNPWAEKLALKSLYTYRCRHHRRRPYLPSSLMRRDSDSEPTHELIDICHQLGIWTDTAWCPTPGARCYRRKDYHGTRATPGTLEVWVPFDRLWRSGNRIGPSGEKTVSQEHRPDGRLWEDNELGHDGEALGTEKDSARGEGKYLPSHLRQSHTVFVEDVKCQQCGDDILERCETCSIKMHCMGCRKTLCGSCAFNRPIPRSRTKPRQSTAMPPYPDGFAMHGQGFADHMLFASTYHSPQPRRPAVNRQRNRYWWAPGATRSPNMMNELPDDSDSDDPDTMAMAFGNGSNFPLLPIPLTMPLKLNMHWCCLEPAFSGGGGVNFLGPRLGGAGSDRYRAVPLPKKREYEDPDFIHSLVPPENIAKLKNMRLYEEIIGENVDILPHLLRDSLELQTNTCPRSLCQECYKSFRWKVACRGCDRPLCKEHDFRGLKVRKCGYRDLETERDFMRNPPVDVPQERREAWDRLRIPKFKATESGTSTPMPGDEWEDLGAETDGQMARINSIASSSAESSQLLLVPPVPSIPGVPSDRPSSSITNFDMTATLATLPPRSVPGPSATPRQRSVSLSGLQDRAAVATMHEGVSAANMEEHRKRFLLPAQPGGCHPVQWQGCGAYFCQQDRPVGDIRGRCSVAMRECGECNVLVCEFCLTAPNTPAQCPCSFCTSIYHCPVCAQKPAIKSQCVRGEELAAIEAARERERLSVKREVEARERADAVATAAGEFLEGLEHDHLVAVAEVEDI